MDYRWELRRSSKKEVCPACGQRRFVPYVSTRDHETPAGEAFGRCDREQNCGYHAYPNGVQEPNVPIVEPKQCEPIRFYPSAVRVDYNTNLFGYVAHLVGTFNAIQIWNRYKIGRDGTRTIWWQIDENGEIRGGKSMPYKPDGHRNKDDKFPANWLHKSAAWRGYFDGQELQQCLFGAHLLKQYPDKGVIIVEAEKTAAVMSAYTTEWIWLAAGGSQGLKNEEKLKCLQGRKVYLIPDNGQYWNWKATADKYGWDIMSALEKDAIFDGCDILDCLEAGALGNDLLYYKIENETTRFEN